MRKRLLITGAFLLALLGLAVQASADDNGIGFSVQMLKNEYQADASKSYFDLLISAGKQTELKVSVQNTSDTTATFDVSLNNATTNDNGIIDYSRHDVKTDSSLRVAFEKIASIKESKVTLNAGETKIISVDLKLPDKEFDGLVIGGIYVIKELDAANTNKSGYTNQYSYVYGVTIRENDKEVKPDLVFKKIDVQSVANLVTIVANIQNPTATNISKATFAYELKDVKTGKVVKSDSTENHGIAPNTNFNINLRYPNDDLKAGNYNLAITIKNADNEWKFDEDFKVTNKEIKEARKASSFNLKKKTNPLVIVAIAAVGILVFVLATAVVVLLKRK
ncbi:MAG: DUF916 and DUF3324 domain-containing protein [Lactobacillales bacterium]|jgi:hypothetical protein|nr:DUF916 and DUF3324 domain-containing protein [Lactobacillales bacterium]